MFEKIHFSIYNREMIKSRFCDESTQYVQHPVLDSQLTNYDSDRKDFIKSIPKAAARLDFN